MVAKATLPLWNELKHIAQLCRPTGPAASMQNLAGSALFLPQGGTHFQLVPLGSAQRVFHGQIVTPDKHIVSAPNGQCPLSKSDPNYSPLKKLKRLGIWKKIDFQHTTITLGLVNK